MVTNILFSSSQQSCEKKSFYYSSILFLDTISRYKNCKSALCWPGTKLKRKKRISKSEASAHFVN